MGLVLQQRPPHMLPQQPNIMAMEQGPRASQASPLLAQHLVGRQQVPQQTQQQDSLHQQHDQMSDSGNANSDDLDNLDTLDGAHHDLGDLGVGGEDLLGMGEDFDIMEFADALDNLEDLSGDEEQTGGKKSDGDSDSATPSSTASPAGTAPNTVNVGSAQPGQRPVQQPPPYTVVASAPGALVRGPPPPYPGPNLGPNAPPQPPGPRVSWSHFEYEWDTIESIPWLNWLDLSSCSVTGFRKWRKQQANLWVASLQTGRPVNPRTGFSCWSLSQVFPSHSQAFAHPGKANTTKPMTSQEFRHWCDAVPKYSNNYFCHLEDNQSLSPAISGRWYGLLQLKPPDF